MRGTLEPWPGPESSPQPSIPPNASHTGPNRKSAIRTFGLLAALLVGVLAIALYENPEKKATRLQQDLSVARLSAWYCHEKDINCDDEETSKADAKLAVAEREYNKFMNGR